MAETTHLLQRTVSILDCFSLEQPVLGVREVARQTGLSVSTVGRLMAGMKSMGMLTQDAETLAYICLLYTSDAADE